MQPGMFIGWIWIAWALSWLIAAFWSSRSVRRPGLDAELGYHVLLLFGVLLFLIPAHSYEETLRLWHVDAFGAWTCVAFELAGFAFAWWARLHIGRLWSGTITRKVEHRLVETGPYALVRHPIYTGILLAVVATAAAKGTVFGIAGMLLIVDGLWMKARLEERWLGQELGSEAYAAYRRRVPMLLPFGPPGD